MKSFADGAEARSLRTLDTFLTTLTEAAGGLPDGFVVTFPKVDDARARRDLRRGARAPGGRARSGRARAAVRGAGRDAAVGDRPRRLGRGPPHPRRGRRAARGDALRGVRLHRVAGADAVGAAARSPGERLSRGTRCRWRSPGPACGSATGRATSCRRATAPRTCTRRGVCTPTTSGTRCATGFDQGWDLHPAHLVEPVRRRLRVAAPAPGRRDLARARLARGGRRGRACSTSRRRSRACCGTCGSRSRPAPSTRPRSSRPRGSRGTSCSGAGRRPA